jgi:hypothetical protein
MKEVRGAFASGSIARYASNPKDTAKTQTLGDDGVVRYDDPDDGRDTGKAFMGF